MTSTERRHAFNQAPRAEARFGAWGRALALLPVLLLAITLVWRQASAPPIELVATPSADEPAPQVLALPGAIEAPPAVGTAPTVAPAVTTGVDARPTVTGAPSQVVRLRIPALAVDAPVQTMGLDAAGAMEVPFSGSSVAWYGFTASPGSPGNAVLAGHVDFQGTVAVFYRLRSLQAGDVIEVATPQGTLRYSVAQTYLVRPEEADIAEIVGHRQGPETLTLITCGGDFDRSRREYDRRVIVRATRL